MTQIEAAMAAPTGVLPHDRAPSSNVRLEN
jgi:hypothetical protein